MKILMCLAVIGMSLTAVHADDMKDNIWDASEDPIEANCVLGDKDLNIKYNVLKALNEAKLSVANGTKDDKINISGEDNNENSIVIEPGSKVNNVINIVNPGK